MTGRVAFLGSPAFAVPSLRALVRHFDVPRVLTQPDRQAGRGLRREATPVRRAAEELGLAVRTYEPKRREAIEAELESLRLDALVVVAFGHILRESTWSRARLGAINVHASLLPRWRGVAPIERCLLAADSHTGVSLMQIDAGVDTGGVFARQTVEIGADETRLTLTDKLSREGAALLQHHLPAILRGDLHAEPQDDSQATYAPKLRKDEGRLDWQQAAEEVERRVRALAGWPGTFTELGERTLKIHALRVVSGPATGLPGSVIEADARRGVIVACGSGLVQLLQVQLPGKSRMAATALVPGRHLQRGLRLGEHPDAPAPETT